MIKNVWFYTLKLLIVCNHYVTKFEAMGIAVVEI